VVQQTLAALNSAEAESYARSLVAETTIRGVREVLDRSAVLGKPAARSL